MIKTAVIFCGGYGKRLGAITKKIPKPMVMVAGKPFLEHLLIQLKENKIKKVFLLVGYKKNKIINYFKDGRKFGLKIEYSYNPPAYETGFRLNCIKNKISEDFLILYCDNYCPINLSKNYFFFKKKKSILTFSIVKKKYGNIYLSKDNNVKYFSTRSIKNKYVEIGYIIVKKSFLKNLNSDNIKLNKYFVKKKINKKIHGLKIFNSYLSISEKKRLDETRKFFKKKNFVLIDRDGVLNIKNPDYRYIRKVHELKMNKKIISILKKFPKITYICITNQAGIATKEIKQHNLNKIHLNMKMELKKNGIKLKQFFVSKHHYNSNNFNRKPNPGNFLNAANKYKILLDKTFYIGDDLRDVIASYNANTKCIFVGNKKKLKLNKNKYLKNTLLANLEKSLYLKTFSDY